MCNWLTNCSNESEIFKNMFGSWIHEGKNEKEKKDKENENEN